MRSLQPVPDRYKAVLSFSHLRHTVGDELGQSTDLDLRESRPEFALHQINAADEHRILKNNSLTYNFIFN